MQRSLPCYSSWLILVAAAATSALDSSCRSSWCIYNIQCVSNASLALEQWSMPSEQGCLPRLVSLMRGSSSGPTAYDLVVQWNKQTGVCSLLHYQHVCRLMRTAIDGTSANCTVYRIAALTSCNATGLSANFQGVWLAGGGSRFSNLACHGDPNVYRLSTGNMQWTEEGANFNGVSSHALLNESRFVIGSASTAGFTWLMRLKRQPQIQPLMEATSCTDISAFGPHMWEFLRPMQLYYDAAGKLAPLASFTSQLGSLPNSSSAWIDIGVVQIAGADPQVKLFYNGAFIGTTTEALGSTVAPNCYLLWIGFRNSSTGYGENIRLNGTVRAVVVANVSMTAGEIVDFLRLLP